MTVSIQLPPLTVILGAGDTLPNLVHHPLDTVLQALAGQRIARTDVPRFVFDLLQPQAGSNLNAAQRIRAVHFVGKEQNGHPPVGNVRMLHQQFQFVLYHH